MKNLARKLLFWVLFVLLVALSVSSLRSAADDLPHAQGAGQKSVGYAGLTCGIAGLVTAAGMGLRRRWCLYAMAICGSACVVAASTATYFYGEAPAYSVVIAGVSTLAAVALLYFGISKTLAGP